MAPPIPKLLWLVPTSGMVNITHEAAEDASLMLLDHRGKVLLTRALSQQPTEALDLSFYGKGLYYLKIVRKENVETKRVVVE